MYHKAFVTQPFNTRHNFKLRAREFRSWPLGGSSEAGFKKQVVVYVGTDNLHSNLLLTYQPSYNSIHKDSLLLAGGDCQQIPSASFPRTLLHPLCLRRSVALWRLTPPGRPPGTAKGTNFAAYGFTPTGLSSSGTHGHLDLLGCSVMCTVFSDAYVLCSDALSASDTHKQ
ncbi:hypothetical protein E2C01_023068 [Portunus trituberculatus]|uniref:Uncharacterized protein n=1 Tax=Portunus trituberculatus TaxID=210409 RepID=A0A5B7E8X7_PORTR|nr:hypothetical protein [Portunus trituberculatus]